MKVELIPGFVLQSLKQPSGLICGRECKYKASAEVQKALKRYRDSYKESNDA
jgi:hypothetical protein